MTATSPPSAIPGPTPETRGKLVQASGSLMPTPFPNTQPSRNQPRDSTKSLIHGFRLSLEQASAGTAVHGQSCAMQRVGLGSQQLRDCPADLVDRGHSA